MNRIPFALLLLAPVALADAKLKIVSTTTDYADLARQIGGDRVEVHAVMKGPQNLHNVMAKPTEMLMLNKAHLFLHGGLDAEPWRDSLLKGARNPRVMPGRAGNVDMSDGIELKDVPAGPADRSMGDIHVYGDPHYALCPANAQRMAATVARALAEADPAGAGAYRDNARRVIDELADLHRELRAELRAHGPLRVVTYHKAWTYFADAFGIEIVATVEPKPSITPSPGQIKSLVELMRQRDVRLLIVETYNSLDEARTIARMAGARAQAVMLPEHVHGVPEADSYQALFRHNVRALIRAAGAARHPATREAGHAR